jgi:hypothetical protein
MHQLVWLLPCYVVKKLLTKNKKIVHQHGGCCANSILQINTIAVAVEVGLDKGYNMIILEKFVK